MAVKSHTDTELLELRSFLFIFSWSDLFSGISMTLLESKNGVQYFTFEHSRDYQQVQFKFLDAVKSMDPNNIVVNVSLMVPLTFLHEDEVKLLRPSSTAVLSVLSC